MGRRAVEMKQADPKGLVRESYRIEGITLGECRSIFLDWALSLPSGVPAADAARLLMGAYASAAPGHPMNAVLQEALAAPPQGGRRGGRAGRGISA
jgi:hypothetical protein